MRNPGKGWDLDDLIAMRVAEKVRAADLDLDPVRRSARADPAWLKEQYPVLHMIAAEVSMELGQPDDSDLWWGVCNAAYDKPVLCGDPKRRTYTKTIEAAE